MQGNGWLAALMADLRARVLLAATGEEGPLDLAALEQEVRAALRLLGTAIVEQRVGRRVREVAGRAQPWGRCGARMRRVGQVPRVLVGLVGDYVLERPYYHCAACRAGAAPLDAELGLGGGVLSPALADVAAYEAVKGPFAEAATALARHHGVAADAGTVRRLAEGLGAVVGRDQQGRARWALPGHMPAPAVLAVELDGVLVHERARWRELKVGRVAALGPALARDQASGEAHLALGPSAYCAGLEGADDFLPRVMREAVRAGWGRGVRTVVLLGDGADWIWRQARSQLGRPGVEVVEILDFYHASEHLGAVAAAAFSAPLPGGAWLDRQRHALRHEGPAPVLQALHALHPASEPAAETVRRARDYFTTHAARMDYPAFRARQFPIGSGAIESAAKNLIQARHVQAGMRWSAAGVQRLASLRALYFSGRWQPFWASMPLHRLRLLPPSPPTTAQPSPAARVASATVPPAQPAPAPGHPRIQTAGKPWAKGKDYWRRPPIASQRAAS